MTKRKRKVWGSDAPLTKLIAPTAIGASATLALIAKGDVGDAIMISPIALIPAGPLAYWAGSKVKKKLKRVI